MAEKSKGQPQQDWKQRAERMAATAEPPSPRQIGEAVAALNAVDFRWANRAVALDAVYFLNQVAFQSTAGDPWEYSLKSAVSLLVVLYNSTGHLADRVAQRKVDKALKALLS